MIKKFKMLILFSFFLFLSEFVYCQIQDTFRDVILHLVDKKGIETGKKWHIARTTQPCNQGYYNAVRDKTFLGKRETYYDICSGKWMKIEYYFLGRRTRTRKNPAFEGVY